jgi:prepilin-type N-terminal cleavage/methylation domain-containing protein
MHKGFTLIEILIVVLITGFIIGVISSFQTNISRSSFLVDETANYLTNIFNLTRQKSLIEEENSNWGVWLINSSSQDYFYIFKNSTSSVKERFNIANQITFFDFTEKIILFNKLTGETTSTVVKIGLINGKYIKEINISTSGSITIK